MSATVVAAGPDAGFTAARAALARLSTLALTSCPDDALLDAHRDLERLRRWLPSLEHQLIVEEQARGLAQRHACRDEVVFVADLLRLHPGDARARVQAADACGSRRAVTGELLPPVFEQVAAAQVAGEIDERCARVIVEAVERLPDALRESCRVQVETSLVADAKLFPPPQVARLARRWVDVLDPDGILRDAAYRHRTRDLRLHQRPDGSGTIRLEGTAELMETLQVCLDALAAPRPEADGAKDPRTPGQRRHDGLLDALRLTVKAGELPHAGGVLSTIVVTLDADTYRTGGQGGGLALTSHGALVPARDALAWGGPWHTRLLTVALSKTRQITAYSTAARLFSEAQRMAVNAVHGFGCSFPGCSVKTPWAELHHIHDYAHGGPTTTDNAAPLCRFDHDHRPNEGWTAESVNGRAGWRPPRWIDPHQRLRFNTLHTPPPRR